MKVTLIIWISAIILQEVEPGTLVRIPRDAANLQSSIHTEYEANYKQKGKHGNDSFSTIKGNQEILHDNCNDTWNEFAEKCAGLVKDLIASLANTISSSPGDATNLQLQIKNNFTHVDTSHKRNCLKRPPTCLSNLNFSSLFNNETGNMLNQPNAVVPISVQTTLKKPDSGEQGSSTPLQQNGDDVILNNSPEDPKRSQQGSSLDYLNGPHMNPEEAEALTGPQINNNRRQVNYPSSELEQSGNAMVRPEDSMIDPSTSSRLPVIPLNTEASYTSGEPRIAFDPNDMSLEISAVPSNAPFNIQITSPNPYSVDRMGNSGNSFLDQSSSNENLSSRGPKALGVPGQLYPSPESSNEFFSNSVDRKNSLSPKYTSQQVSSEEEKYHTFLPPQSLVGEPLLGDSQQLHEEFESDENPAHKQRGHAHPGGNGHLLPHPPSHDRHPPLPVIVDEEPPAPVVPNNPFIAPTTASQPLLNSALPPMLPSQDSQSKEPSSSLLSADDTPDISKTNASPPSISHQDPLQELKPHDSFPPSPIDNQPVITEDATPSILVPVSEPKKTQPDILPAQISNVEPAAKEISHDHYSNGNEPVSPLESVPSPESTEPQILSFPQSPNKPLEASNHLSQPITEPAESGGDLVSLEDEKPEKESADDESPSNGILLLPTSPSKEPIPHFHKHPSSSEKLEIIPAHDPHNPHQHSHPHPHPHSHLHPHHDHHPGSPIGVDEDDEKPLPDIKHIPIVEIEEKPSSSKRELVDPHPSQPKIELVPVSPSEKEPPLPPPPPKVELVPVHLPEKELTPLLEKIEGAPVPPPKKELPPPPQPPKMELVPVLLPEKELTPPPPPPPPEKIELVPIPPPKKELPPLPPPPPKKVELVPVLVPEKELPPPPEKMELVPLPPPEKGLPPPPPPKIELVPVLVPEKELPPPPPPPKKELPPPPPPKIELVPVLVPEKELPVPPPPPPKKELPPPPPPPKKELVPGLPVKKEVPFPPPEKIEVVPVPVPEKELPPPPPPKIEMVPVLPVEKELPPPPPPKIELVPVPLQEKELPPPPSKVELVPVVPVEKEVFPPTPPKIESVPVSSLEKELPPPPPPPPKKVELVPVLVPEKELPPPPPTPEKIELVPVPSPEKEQLSPPPKMELVPVLPVEKELPPPLSKVDLVPVPLPEKELPSLPPPPPKKVELVPVLVPEEELPPPPPPKIELEPVPLPEKELPPPPPPKKVELVPVLVPEKELPPPPPPPPEKIELVPLPPPEKELPPPPPKKMELVPVLVPEEELPPPPPPKIELEPVPLPEKELPPPPPPKKVELVPVLVPEKELPPPPPPPPEKIELVPLPPPEKELPPPPPKKMELVPVLVPEEELPPPPPPKIELEPVPLPEKELPPPPPLPPKKMELVPVHVPEKELPPPPPPPPEKMELVPLPPPEKELPPPPPPKVELVPIPLPEKELPPPPPPPEKEPPSLPPLKIKLVPVSSLEQKEMPSKELDDDKPFADMPWSPHEPHPAHHHHPHHPPPRHPHHGHHHQPPKKEDDDSDLYSAELQPLEEEKATTFQTTSADPTPPESSLSYPLFFMPNPTSQAPPPLTLPNSEPYPLIPSTTTFKAVPESKNEDNEEDDEEEEEDCCSCESCREDDKSDVKNRRTSACQDLEQARRELKAIFDKIKKKLKCGRKTQRPTTITT